jgi:NTE family protein
MPGLDIHAGIWLALEEAGIVPTDLAGTSAGAIVSALQAAGHNAPFSAATVRGLTDSSVRAEVPLWKFRIPWLDHFLDNRPILALLDSLLPPTFDALTLRFSAWATRLDTGQSVNVARPGISPSPARAALASMSICGVFPSVLLADGHAYVDGGVRRNLPLPANWRGFDEVWLLIAAGSPSDYQRRPGILTNLVRNVHYLMQDQIADVLEEVCGTPSVRVIWPSVRATRGVLHFDHDLIEQAYVDAKAAIKAATTCPSTKGAASA